MPREVERLEAALRSLDQGVEASSLDLEALEELERRGLVRPTPNDDTSHGLELTPAGRTILDRGFDREPRQRRTNLSDPELETFHRLLWDCAGDIEGETRRRRGKGVKWILHEHFGIDTRDGAGPHGRVRRDALRRLEDIGAIEQVGGGAAKRTGVCWVVNPMHLQYPW